MRLFGILEAYQVILQSQNHQQLTQDEFLTLLIDAEWKEHRNRHIQRLTTKVKSRYRAYFSELPMK